VTFNFRPGYIRQDEGPIVTILEKGERRRKTIPIDLTDQLFQGKKVITLEGTLNGYVSNTEEEGLILLENEDGYTHGILCSEVVKYKVLGRAVKKTQKELIPASHD